MRELSFERPGTVGNSFVAVLPRRPPGVRLGPTGGRITTWKGSWGKWSVMLAIWLQVVRCGAGPHGRRASRLAGILIAEWPPTPGRQGAGAEAWGMPFDCRPDFAASLPCPPRGLNVGCTDNHSPAGPMASDWAGRARWPDKEGASAVPGKPTDLPAPTQTMCLSLNKGFAANDPGDVRPAPALADRCQSNISPAACQMAWALSALTPRGGPGPAASRRFRSPRGFHALRSRGGLRWADGAAPVRPRPQQPRLMTPNPDNKAPKPLRSRGSGVGPASAASIHRALCGGRPVAMNTPQH